MKKKKTAKPRDLASERINETTTIRKERSVKKEAVPGLRMWQRESQKV